MQRREAPLRPPKARGAPGGGTGPCALRANTGSRQGPGAAGRRHGLRPGELFGLQLRHADLLHATVTVEQQIQQTAKHGVYVGPPKTARSHHTVPLPKMAVAALKTHLRDFPVDGAEGAGSSRRPRADPSSTPTSWTTPGGHRAPRPVSRRARAPGRRRQGLRRPPRRATRQPPKRRSHSPALTMRQHGCGPGADR
ncbi:hypothetical protein SCOCK_240052 [Actinacidiphila cocklensis]|uniref:Tyr recombinase domain-containing protein n=1 Tax=Actinacidiphila cocklensis TaxID=887465 RepID=A0A9W4DME4_9ACTN|nr:hypothetical protein SCOCK_240052 [Actinacidiphila cocklensis]